MNFDYPNAISVYCHNPDKISIFFRDGSEAVICRQDVSEDHFFYAINTVNLLIKINENSSPDRDISKEPGFLTVAARLDEYISKANVELKKPAVRMNKVWNVCQIRESGDDHSFYVYLNGENDEDNEAFTFKISIHMLNRVNVAKFAYLQALFFQIAKMNILMNLSEQVRDDSEYAKLIRLAKTTMIDIDAKAQPIDR